MFLMILTLAVALALYSVWCFLRIPTNVKSLLVTLKMSGQILDVQSRDFHLHSLLYATN